MPQLVQLAHPLLNHTLRICRVLPRLRSTTPARTRIPLPACVHIPVRNAAATTNLLPANVATHLARTRHIAAALPAAAVPALLLPASAPALTARLTLTRLHTLARLLPFAALPSLLPALAARRTALRTLALPSLLTPSGLSSLLPILPRLSLSAR